jgi:hypothetical protein
VFSSIRRFIGHFYQPHHTGDSAVAGVVADHLVYWDRFLPCPCPVRSGNRLGPEWVRWSVIAGDLVVLADQAPDSMVAPAQYQWGIIGSAGQNAGGTCRRAGSRFQKKLQS